MCHRVRKDCFGDIGPPPLFEAVCLVIPRLSGELDSSVWGAHTSMLVDHLLCYTRLSSIRFLRDCSQLESHLWKDECAMEYYYTTKSVLVLWPGHRNEYFYHYRLDSESAVISMRVC
jgi:hypothetical protein